MCAPKPGPAPWALRVTSALSGPPVRAVWAAMAASGMGRRPALLSSLQTAAPLAQVTESMGTSHSLAARAFMSSTSFSAACTTAMPVAKVVREPPVSMEKPIDAVSATIGRTFSTGRPRVSAAIIAMEARLPPMSGLPVTTTAPPSSLMCTAAVDSPPTLNQKPTATPRPWFGPRGAE